MKNKKKMICKIVLFVILTAMSLKGSHTVAEAAKKSDKAQIQEEVKKKLSGKDKIKKTFWLDYDKNGRKEAFILTGKPPKNHYEKDLDGENTLWFGYKSGGKVHLKKIKEHIAISAHTLKLKSASFLCAGRWVATSFPEDMYQVKGNKVRVIFSGDMIRKLKGDDFTSVHSAYDSAYDAGIGNTLGHTWKPYYYTYKNGKVSEYEAVQNSQEELTERYSNAAEMLEKYRGKGEIHSILSRSNGMIHVNYQKKSKNGDIAYWYVTFRVSHGKLVKISEHEGTYQEKNPSHI